MRQFKLITEILFWTAALVNAAYFGTRHNSFWPANSIYYVFGFLLVAIALKMVYLYKAKDHVKLKQSLWSVGIVAALALIAYFGTA